MNAMRNETMAYPLPCTGQFDGEIRVNGELHSQDVYVSLDQTLVIQRSESGFSPLCISMYPFSQFMIFIQDAALMKSGFHYEVKGTDVGGVRHGAPADGYCRHRLTAFDLNVQYFHGGVHVEIEGTDLPGCSATDPTCCEDLRQIYVRFDIPKGRMATFFNLSEPVRARVHALFDEVFGAA